MTYPSLPQGPRAWLDAGLAAHRSGDLERAASCYRQALSVAPGNGDALNLLGTALLQMGQPADALSHLEPAARALRNNPHVLANLAQCYMAVGRHDAAAEAFRKATRADPKEIGFQLGLGSALALQGKLDEAESVLQRAAKRAPRSAAVWLNLGNVARDREQRQEAIDRYAKAVELDPAMPEARNNLGSALQSKLRFAEAEAQYRECIRLAPQFLIARFNLASVLMDLGRFAESENVARDLVALAPGASEPHGLLGSALGMQSRLIEAHACYERAAELAPHAPKSCETVAMSFVETGRSQEGLQWFSRALASGADEGRVRQLMAAALLADGAIHDGLVEYRMRHDATVFRQQNPGIAIEQAVLAAPEGKSVCVLGEQGLGDEIFFLRYAQGLAARGAAVTYRAGAKIAPLVARLPYLAKVITAGEPLPDCDACYLVADLPHALHSLDSSTLPALPLSGSRALARLQRHISIHWPPVPPSVRIEPLPEAAARVRERLAAMGPPPYIGVTWRAGTLPEEQRSSNWLLYKHVDLDALASVFRGVGGTLLALQRAPSESELSRLRSALGREIHDLSALNDDLEEMLALLAEIDDYVGVSNTNMHLRAAVGKTARVLVPAPAEWRWMRRGGQSPWFPGFAIYRQSFQGDWSRALAALERDLAGNYASPHPSTSS